MTSEGVQKARARPEAARGAEPQASTERVRTWQRAPLPSGKRRSYASERGGFGAGQRDRTKAKLERAAWFAIHRASLARTGLSLVARLSLALPALLRSSVPPSGTANGEERQQQGGFA